MNKKRTTTAKLSEATVVVLLFSLFVHLLTSASVRPWDMSIALAIVLITVVLACKSLVKDWDSGRRLLAALSALAGGFWLFSLFRYVGIVRWPLGHPAELAAYFYLLYSHFVLSMTVLAPVLVVWSRAKPVTTLSWGSWRITDFPCLGLPLLLLSSVTAWIFAFHTVLVDAPSLSGPFTGFIVVCLLKAFLTGVTEEICYRGIIQPLAIAHFGVALGIVFQSCLFTAFHMHLGEPFFPRGGFLAAVMALGLIFGLVTRLTSGIGWASVIHVAISVVIEWHNLS